MKDYAELEKRLRGLLKGEHSSLYLTFNSENGPSYQSVADVADDDRFLLDWVSAEERAAAIQSNSIWTLQWYPDTPIGSYSVSASTLEALLTHCLSRDLADDKGK